MADGFLGRWSRRKAGKQDELAETIPLRPSRFPHPLEAPHRCQKAMVAL